MPLVAFLLLALALLICLIPVWLLRQPEPRRAQDYLVASQYTRPEVVRNSSIAYALRMAAFGPLFAWGASGDLWPAIIAAASFGLGIYLIYILRQPVLDFLDGALSSDRSITVHEFIARQHGDDPRVRLLAASLTLFSLLGLLASEALALAAFLRPMLQSSAVIYLLTVGALLMVVLSAALSGHSGIMHSTQLQLGILYLGLFGSTVLLLYLHVSSRTPMPAHGTLAVVFVAVCAVMLLCYRRSKYVDTDPIRRAASNAGLGRDLRWSRALSRFGKIFNIFLSLLLVLIITLTLMEGHAAGWPTIMRESAAALLTGTRVPGVALLALVLLPLFYPLADVTNWLRIAAIRKDLSPSVEPDRRSAALHGFFRTYAAETSLMWLFMCAFGAVAVAIGTRSGTDVLKGLVAQLTALDNWASVATLSLLLICAFAVALSTMGALFSASLCTLRYDVLALIEPELRPRGAEAKEASARRHTLAAGAGLGLAAAALCLAAAFLQANVAGSTFLALLFALCCGQLSLAPLVVGSIAGRMRDGAGTVSPGWALVILGSGFFSGVAAAVIYLVTGVEAWLWSAAPACIGTGFVLFAIARAASRAPA